MQIEHDHEWARRKLAWLIARLRLLLSRGTVL